MAITRKGSRERSLVGSRDSQIERLIVDACPETSRLVTFVCENFPALAENCEKNHEALQSEIAQVLFESGASPEEVSQGSVDASSLKALGYTAVNRLLSAYRQALSSQLSRCILNVFHFHNKREFCAQLLNYLDDPEAVVVLEMAYGANRIVLGTDIQKTHDASAGVVLSLSFDEMIDFRNSLNSRIDEHFSAQKDEQSRLLYGRTFSDELPFEQVRNIELEAYRQVFFSLVSQMIDQIVDTALAKLTVQFGVACENLAIGKLRVKVLDEAGGEVGNLGDQQFDDPVAAEALYFKLCSIRTEKPATLVLESYCTSVPSGQFSLYRGDDDDSREANRLRFSQLWVRDTKLWKGPVKEQFFGLITAVFGDLTPATAKSLASRIALDVDEVMTWCQIDMPLGLDNRSVWQSCLMIADVLDFAGARLKSGVPLSKTIDACATERNLVSIDDAERQRIVTHSRKLRSLLGGRSGLTQESLRREMQGWDAVRASAPRLSHVDA